MTTTSKQQGENDSMDSAVEYVNCKLSSESSESLSQQASTLLSNLQVELTDTTSQLQDIIKGLERSKLRLQYQISLLQSDCIQLTETVCENDVKVKEIISSKPTSLTKLENLQHVKVNLQSVIDIFEQAKNKLGNIDNENATFNEISNLIKDQDYIQADDKIKSLQKLILIWKGTAEYKSKCDFVSSLQSMLDDQRIVSPPPLQQSSIENNNNNNNNDSPQSTDINNTSSPLSSMSFGGRLFGQFKRMGY